MSASFDTATIQNLREMSLNRLAFSLIAFTYFILQRSLENFSLLILLYLVINLASYAWSYCRSRVFIKPMLVYAAIADVGMISLSLHLDGRGDAALFPLYLWVILGNGFRFGNQALFLAAALSCLGFATAAACTPYWARQPSLSISLLLALLALPAYSSTLISKLSRARAQAEAANRAKSMFLAAISHELRTPLNAIVGSVSLIEDTPLNEEQQSLFKATHSGTQALLSLIGGILDFSRAEAGLMPVAHEPVDLPSLLVEIRNLVAMQARLKSLPICLHAAADVPAAIMGSRKMLMEVLLNLVSNAVKFTEAGSICIAVSLDQQASMQPRTLRFEVSDTGIGIAAHAQAGVFDVFSQADAGILDRFGGSGLGLALCRQFVGLMGGAIGVDSALGQGSTFWFTITLSEPDPPESNSSFSLIKPGTSAALLCDDKILAGILADALRAQGLSVRHVPGPQFLQATPGQNVAGEILFLYRYDFFDDLAADCAILDQVNPDGAMPCVLLAGSISPSASRQTLGRHFITAIAVPASVETLRRACIWAASALDKPTVSRSVEPKPGGEPHERADAGGRSLRVLIADDNAINRQVLGRILDRSGHRFIMVENGTQALDAMERQPFDLVLMDINMPQMNGLEATRLFRFGAGPGQYLPILALTADATKETEAKCMQAGMDGCITKPITPTQLTARIEEFTHGPPPVGGKMLAPVADHPRSARRVPCLDPEVLAELRSLGGDDFIANLLDGFVADSAALINRLERAIAANDMAGFRFEMHALCSSAANIGATKLFDSAAARHVTQATLATDGQATLRRLRHEVACIACERQALCRPVPAAHPLGNG